MLPMKESRIEQITAVIQPAWYYMKECDLFTSSVQNQWTHRSIEQIKRGEEVNSFSYSAQETVRGLVAFAQLHLRQHWGMERDCASPSEKQFGDLWLQYTPL